MPERLRWEIVVWATKPDGKKRQIKADQFEGDDYVESMVQLHVGASVRDLGKMMGPCTGHLPGEPAFEDEHNPPDVVASLFCGMADYGVGVRVHKSGSEFVFERYGGGGEGEEEGD